LEIRDQRLHRVGVEPRVEFGGVRHRQLAGLRPVCVIAKKSFFVR
jgi:hypothetical protein